jgi:hypothetical protein
MAKIERKSDPGSNEPTRVSRAAALLCRAAFIAALAVMPFLARIAATHASLAMWLLLWMFYSVSAAVLRSTVVSRALIGLLAGGILGEIHQPSVQSGDPAQDIQRVLTWAFLGSIVGFIWGIVAEQLQTKPTRGSWSFARFWPLPHSRAPRWLRLACRAAFIAALIVMPVLASIARLVERQHAIWLLLGIWMFYSISAVILESLIVAGALLGLLAGGGVGVFCSPVINGGDGTGSHWPLLIGGLVGIALGIAWAVATEMLASKRARRSWWSPRLWRMRLVRSWPRWRLGR